MPPRRLSRAGAPPPDGPQLGAGAALDVPLWLAPELVKRRMLELEMPSMFNQRVRSQLDAGPGPFDLRARSPHWYEVGSRLNSLVADPAPDADGSVGALVLETFLGRYRWAPAPSALGGALPPGARASSPSRLILSPPPPTVAQRIGRAERVEGAGGHVRLGGRSAHDQRREDPVHPGADISPVSRELAAQAQRGRDEGAAPQATAAVSPPHASIRRAAWSIDRTRPVPLTPL